MSTIVTTSDRGQVTIPKKFRDQFQTSHFQIKSSAQGIFLIPVEVDADPAPSPELLAELEEIYQDYQQNGGYSWEEVMAESNALES